VSAAAVQTVQAPVELRLAEDGLDHRLAFAIELGAAVCREPLARRRVGAAMPPRSGLFAAAGVRRDEQLDAAVELSRSSARGASSRRRRAPPQVARWPRPLRVRGGRREALARDARNRVRRPSLRRRSRLAATSTQRHHPPHRRHPAALPPRNPRRHRSQTRRRQEHQRRHPLPQTSPHPAHLAPPPTARPQPGPDAHTINLLT
jgi:hypothetical protein